MEHVQLGLEIVEKLSKYFAGKYSLDYTELYSYASAKLVVALRHIEAYDHTAKNPKAYINKSIRGHLLNYMRDYARPLRMPRQYTNVHMLEKSIKNRFPDASDAQIALEIGITVKALQEARSAMSLKYVPLDDDNSERYTTETAPMDYAINFLQEMPADKYELLEDIYLHKLGKNRLEQKYNCSMDVLQAIADAYKDILEDLL